MSIRQKFNVTIFLLLCFISSIYSQSIIRNNEINPDFLKWLEGRTQTFSSDGHALGEIPPPYIIHTELPAYLKERLRSKESAIATFDLRTAGELTSVKDQGACGSCWTFATMAAIESRWLVNGRGTYDLSEDNLNTCHTPFEWAPCNGGNTSISLAYLSRGSGPKSESDDPYSETHTSVDCPSDLSPQGLVTSGWFIPKSDANLIKEIIQIYGALATNMRWVDSCYNSSNYTYYYSGSDNTNHAVTLVGWDDNKVTAGGTGAWIIKNSWGTSWGESGFFYIAYQDLKVNSTVTLFKDYKDYDPYETVATYSESGWIVDLGFGVEQADALVKFTASGNVQLTKIGTWSVYPGAVVTIEVYDTFDGSSSLTGLLGSISSQTCTYTGYNTFNLSSPIHISDGNDYYVKISYQTTGYNYPVPVEEYVAGYTNPTFETGKCWIKGTDESSWTSLDDYDYDICIYAYSNTIPVTFTDGSTFTPPNANPSTTNNPVGQFKLTSLYSGATLSTVTVKFSGEYEGVTNVKLWSSTDDTFGSDTQIGITQSYNTSVTFDGLSSLISTSGTYYFVTFDLGASSGSVNASIENSAAITISAGMVTTTIINAVLSNGGTALPVELTSFTAAVERTNATLKWSTATEINNYGFEIERRKIADKNSASASIEGAIAASQWSKASFVSGSGISNSPKEYSFTDRNLQSGHYAYRIKQINQDGTYKYSESVEVEIGIVPKALTLSQNYPNPFNPMTTIEFTLAEDSRVSLKVFDMLGREVATLISDELKAGVLHQKTFDVSKLSSGIYIYQLQAGNTSVTKKLMVLK